MILISQQNLVNPDFCSQLPEVDLIQFYARRFIITTVDNWETLARLQPVDEPS